MTKQDFNKIMRTTPGCVGSLVGLMGIAGLAILAVYHVSAFIIVVLVLVILAGMWALSRYVYKLVTRTGGE